MKKQIYIICLTIFCGLLIVGCSSDNLGEQDNKNETEQAQFNKDIEPNIETLLMMPSAKNQFISSSAIKEFVIYNIDISPYVPKEIVPYVTKKFKSNNTKTLL